MHPTPSADRRKHQRQPFAAGVELYHSASGREFPARCVDISSGGLLMYVPAAAPLQAGQPLRIALADGLPRPADQAPLPAQATIVRVDRRKLLSMGYLAVGVQFAEA